MLMSLSLMPLTPMLLSLMADADAAEADVGVGVGGRLTSWWCMF